jgi:hypothetical protein
MGLNFMERFREVMLICFVVLVRAVFFILKWVILIWLILLTIGFGWGFGYVLGEEFNWLRGYGQ